MRIKKMGKKLVSVTLGLVMALSLAGCNGGGDGAVGSSGGEDKTQGAGSDQATTQGTTQVASKVSESDKGKGTAKVSSQGKTKIAFINGFTGGDGSFMTKIVDGFNASQDEYYIEQLQDADHYTKFKSGDFDMLVIHADMISTYHAMGLLREASDLYEKAGLSLENDFHPIAQTYCKYDDGVFAFPLDLYAETFFYNKEYVKKAPETYSDMVALRDQLKSETSGIYPISIPLTGDEQWAWMTALGQMGCNWVEDGHIKMDTDQVADAFMKIHDLIYKDHLSASGLGGNDHFNTFIKQSKDNTNVSAVTCLTGPWNYTAAKEVLGDNLGVGILPQLYGDKKAVPAGGHTFAVSSKVTDEKKLNGIAAFMKFAYQPKVMLNWADSGQAPIHLKTMELVKASPDKYPVANVNYGIFDYAMLLPTVYNVREQVKYVNSTVWSLVIQTPDLKRADLMKELKNATDTAKELSQM